MSSPCPLHKWGIDIVGPFPEALGKVKCLVVSIDYFKKWIEAEPIATINGRCMIKLMWKNILTRFGTQGHLSATMVYSSLQTLSGNGVKNITYNNDSLPWLILKPIDIQRYPTGP